jgi:hypothetical protein
MSGNPWTECSKSQPTGRGPYLLQDENGELGLAYWDTGWYSTRDKNVDYVDGWCWDNGCIPEKPARWCPIPEGYVTA